MSGYYDTDGDAPPPVDPVRRDPDLGIRRDAQPGRPVNEDGSPRDRAWQRGYRYGTYIGKAAAAAVIVFIVLTAVLFLARAAWDAIMFAWHL